jgi:uncharacterized protein YqfA (UPF0365 family)
MRAEGSAVSEILIGVLAFILGGIAAFLVMWSRAWLFWLRAKSAGVPVQASEVILSVMARRHSERCHDAWLTCREADIDLPVSFFTGHHRSGGDVTILGRALVAARRGGVPIDPHKLAATALAHTDIIELVRKHLEPELSYNDPRTFGIAVGTSGILGKDAWPLGQAHLGSAPQFPVFAADAPIKAGTAVVVKQVHGNHVAVMPLAP